MNRLGKNPMSWICYAICAFIIGQLCFFASAQAADSDENLREKSLNHRVRSVQYWGNEWKKTAFPERLAKAPDALIEKICLDNRLDGFTEIPVPAEPPVEFLEAAKKAVSGLPGPVIALARERIIGIFAVTHLGGSGYVETVLDENGRERYAFIVLDRDVLLKRKANEWATWKERSVFHPSADQRVDLQVAVEAGGDNTAENAVVYILLHEIGHFMGIASCAHSSWTQKSIAPTPFSNLSWLPGDHPTKSIYDRVFPERALIKPYAFERSRLKEDQIEKIYQILNTKTNFPTIHAATDVWEDFAESFVSYIHVVRDKKPYEVKIKTAGRPDIVYMSCWGESRCRDKRLYMDRWFADPFFKAPPSCR